ncbi:phage major capsid protein [Roseicyclus sp.]|uniref:phage major capsid protein n=1 Tax=Roseicyclus sp. TaxID=1914329 RepID=UPI003F6AA175
MSIQALREQRAAKAKDLHELVNKNDWNTETDQAVYDAGIAEIDRIDAQIKRIEEVNAKLAEETRMHMIVEASERTSRDSGDKGLAIYAKWLKGGDKALNEEDWGHIRNTMSTGTGSEGGFTVDTEVATSVIDALKAYGGMRQAATVIATTGYGLLSFPTSNGTAEKGEIVEENASATDEDIAFGTVGLPVYKFSSKVVTVPIELLQDSNVDIEAFVRGRLVDRLGRVTNELFTTGTGISQPRGIVTGATVGVTAANSTSQVTAVTYDSLVNLQHSVDPSYRRSAAWMFNDTTMRELRKIKDSQSRPIFVPGYEAGVPGGEPDRLLGAPIIINQDVANMAASAKSILFGDMSGYYIRDVMAVEMFRFTDSAFTKKGQVGFLAWMRSGGNLIDANKVRVFVNAAS